MLQALVGGLTAGAIYALLGLGIVLVFSVSRFVNLAQGEFFVYGALIATTLVGLGLPIGVAAILAIATVAALAAALDRAVFSRLTGASHATQLLGGIGVALAMAGGARVIWGTGERSLPELVSWPPIEIFGARVSAQALFLGLALTVSCGLLWLMLGRTMLGMKMRAVAALSTQAGILAIDVRAVTTISFALAGAVGALAGVLVTPLVFVSYHSGLILTVYGFIAAAFGGLKSVRGAVVGGLLLGVLEAATAYFIDSALKTPIALSALVVVLIFRSIREGAWAGTLNMPSLMPLAKGRPGLPAVSSLPVRRRLARSRATLVGVSMVTIFAIAGPALLPPYWVSVWSFIGIFVIVGIGLDLLLGYTGQLSLGQTTFMGVAAYLVALSVKWWDLSAWGAAVIAVVGTATLAAVLGFFVLRLRGFYFTLATLAVAIGAEALVNGLPTQLGGSSGLGVTTTLSVGSFALDTPARLFGAIWIVVAVSLGLALRLTRSRFGLSMLAVGHDESLAAASAVASFPVKLKVFVASSIFAAVAGVLYAHTLLYVSPPVVGFVGGFDTVMGLLLGGFGTVWGAVIGIPIIRLLPELGAQYTDYQLLLYGALVVVLVLSLPDGIVGGCRRVWRSATQRPARPERHLNHGDVDVNIDDTVQDQAREHGEPVLLAENLVKRFRGLVAVHEVGLGVRAGEIVGLIGPNGAGKSTTLSLLAGSLQTDDGRVSLSGTDVTRLSAASRADCGLARTFQLPHVPEAMSVLEVATLGAVRRGRAGLIRGLLGATVREQLAMQETGRRALALTGIDHLAHVSAANLSTGEQKMLELARAIAASPTVLLADEPAGGLAEEEVERLAIVLERLAATGLAIVLVEHEMRLVMRVCDEVVVLNEGRIIGSGTPDEVRAHQGVLDAYLGI